MRAEELINPQRVGMGYLPAVGIIVFDRQTVQSISANHITIRPCGTSRMRMELTVLKLIPQTIPAFLLEVRKDVMVC